MHTRQLAMGAALALAITSLPAGAAMAGAVRATGAAACGASGGPVLSHALPATSGAAASAATPAAGTWTTTPIGTLATSGGDGGFAVADGLHATIVVTDDDTTWARRTSDGGAIWAPPVRLTPFGWHVLSGTTAQRGADVDIANAAYKGSSGRIFVRHSPDGGATWEPTVGLTGSDYGPVLARGGGGLVVLGSTPDPAVRIRISRDGGATFGRPIRVGAYDPGSGCAYDPGFTGVAVSGRVVLVFHWKNQKKLIVHRSADGGRTWGAARLVHAGRQGADTVATAVNGSTVLVAFHSGPNLLIRRSTDGGLTWSPATSFTSGGWGISLTRADGRWRIVYTHGHALRYRSSVNGLAWTGEETVASFPALDSARTVGVGVMQGGVVAPWLHTAFSSDQDTLEWSARS